MYDPDEEEEDEIESMLTIPGTEPMLLPTGLPQTQMPTRTTFNPQPKPANHEEQDKRSAGSELLIQETVGAGDAAFSINLVTEVIKIKQYNLDGHGSPGESLKSSNISKKFRHNETFNISRPTKLRGTTEVLSTNKSKPANSRDNKDIEQQINQEVAKTVSHGPGSADEDQLLENAGATVTTKTQVLKKVSKDGRIH